jgi:16S rRNA (guanine527-N7)-methyltransferase
VIGVSLGSDSGEALVRFEELLRARAIPGGLIASGDAARLRTRHLLDSLRAAAVVEPGDRSAFDLGSGAGLPGIPVAIACPQLRIWLVEPKRLRVGFLELVVHELGIGNVGVVGRRVEELAGQEPGDLCFARGFAPLERSWRVATHVLRPGGRLVFFAGARAPKPKPPPGATLSDVRPPPALEIPGEPRGLERAGPLVIMSRQ